jgi:phosphate acetyltransferase
MTLIERLRERCSGFEATIVLPEGHDPRVMAAAAGIAGSGLARVIVLATPEEAASSMGDVSFEGLDVEVKDFLAAPEAEEYAACLHELRARKGMTPEQAREQVKKRLYFGNLMVRKGRAHGLVAGSIASTPDMLRAAFHCIGTAPGLKVGSSSFVMELQTPTAAGDDVLLYADSGVNPNPTAEELVDIAIATAQTRIALIGDLPKVGFLAFSTKGSAKHEIVDKMIKATELARERFAAAGIEAVIDGELQADSAIVPAVAAKKCPDSPLAGAANILIFPDLNCGNICYKLTERLAGANAFGPILQGLAKPLNDLSRGCSVDDIVGVAAITICQAMELQKHA